MPKLWGKELTRQEFLRRVGSADQLFGIEWMCMRSGDYALGLLPSTCKPLGRAAAKEAGELTLLHSFIALEVTLECTILESEQDFLSNE